MPWSGGSFTRTNGVNTGSTLWAQDRDDGTKILATRHDTNDQDMANGINSTLEKSGSNAATGNLNIGSNRLTAVADGTAKTDAATVNQIQSNAPAFQATDTGTANAHVIALSPAITAYAAGQRITFKSGAASTGASTLNVNTLGVKALKKLHDQDIASGDIESGSIVTAVYDGTNFQVTSQLASEAADAGAAYAGVLQANANFVDQVIFGPSVDGVPWNGAWSKASVYSSLMLATIEDEGANTEINIWDLTEESAGVISTTPLATVDLSAAATPTSIAAAMGYLIVGSEDGIAIIDPHSGAWAERTVGWPRTLSTSTTPALSSNAVGGVAAGPSNQPAFDPRTGGPIPTFAVTYTSGSDYGSVIKDDGNVWDDGGSAGTGVNDCAIDNGRIYQVEYNGGSLEILWKSIPIEEIVSDATYDKDGVLRNDAGAWNYGWELDKKVSIRNAKLATANTSGLTIGHVNTADMSGYGDHISALINRTYNTGMLTADTRGAWLANSVTVDRSPYGNTLTENGTVTEAVVETSAELKGYSGFSDSTNYLSRAFDADFDFGTANFSAIIWFKRTATSGAQYLWARKSTASGGSNIFCSLANGAHTLRMFIGDGSNSTDNSGIPYTGSVWNQLVVVWDGTLGTNSVYINGVLRNTTTNASVGTLTNSNATLAVGATDDGTAALDQGSVSLFRLSTTAPNATQIRQMYDAEKGMFVASAECLLQSGSTDAVLDVDVDPLSGKVLVTQTDAITIFDGLTVDSKPTVNSGNSEKGKLWGALRAEQNSANAYVTAPATDQRQVNEMVRGLASDLPAGPDLGKAKAFFRIESGGIALKTSFNVKSVTNNGTGDDTVTFGVPFKTKYYAAVATGGQNIIVDIHEASGTPSKVTVRGFQKASGGTASNGEKTCVVFGELENE